MFEVNKNQFVRLQNNDWLTKQRIAGKITADTLTLLKNLVLEKTSKSLIELDKVAEDYIISNNCIPTFKGYHGFPNSVCISVNKTLVHGICTDYVLQDGDVVSFDLGATFEEGIADSALTCIFGEPKSQQHIDLVQTTKECLTKAIEVIEVGKHLGCIGNAIYKYAKSKGFSVVDKFGGHGINPGQVHAEPFVSNRADKNEGIRIQPGLTIAIEPLLVIGSSNKTTLADDGWTINAMNICAHEEHSLYIHEDHVEIISIRN